MIFYIIATLSIFILPWLVWIAYVEASYRRYKKDTE